MLSQSLLKLANLIDEECDANCGDWAKEDLIQIADLIRTNYEKSLIMEEELVGLRRIRDVMAKIAKQNGYRSSAEKRRDTFAIVGGTHSKTQSQIEEAQDV